MTEKSRVEKLLRDHEYALSLSTGAICTCGYTPPAAPERGWAQQDWHRDHLADVLTRPS